VSIVFFDLETGGLLPTSPDIQLAAVAVDSEWNELATFERKIQFDREKADEEALRLNHFDADRWAKEAIKEALAVAQFARFIEPFKSIELVSKRTNRPYSVARLAGHNAATFDGPRIQAMFARHSQFLPSHPQVMCSLQRALWYAVETGTQFKSLKLSVLCEHFQVPLADAHDALADVRGSIAISRAMAVSK
jgi:DNA polymerase III epsilon subunit-like protein